MNYVASPHFKLNSQCVCFLRFLSKMTNWGSTFLPQASEMGSLVFSPLSRGKCMLVICVWARWRNAAVLTGVFGVRVCSLSLLFVWVCQSVYRVLCSHVDWLTNLSMWAWFRLTGQISASELVYCSRDEPKVHEDGGFGWVTLRTCF